MAESFVFTAEDAQALGELSDYIKNSPRIKTFLDKTQDYPYFKGKPCKYIGMFLCQGSTVHYMCNSNLIDTYLKADHSLLKDGRVDYWNANYYKEAACPDPLVRDYDVYIFYEGVDNQRLWRKARMNIKKEEGFDGKKMDITKKTIPLDILSNIKSYDDAIREYIKHGAMGYHLRKRPIIMLDPEIKVLWHGQSGVYPNFKDIVVEY